MRTRGSTAASQELRTELRGREERRARRLAEMLALCLQGSLLLRYAPDEVASAFVSSPVPPRRPVAHGGHAAGRGAHRACDRVTPGRVDPAQRGRYAVNGRDAALTASGADAGAGGPPLAQLGERLVAERVHARAGGQRVRDVDVQALDPARACRPR